MKPNYVLGLALFTMLSVLSEDASADASKAECVAANGNAQSLRREGKLAEARQQLRLCMSPSCPALVSTDCVKRLDELESAQPTVVFSVQDHSGRDVSAVTVTIDGRPLVDRLDGTALAIDPGEHTFTFSAEGQRTVTHKLVLREGEKGRRERVTFDAPANTPAPNEMDPARTNVDGASRLPAVSPKAAPLNRQKLLGLGIGGLGLAAAVVGSVFGLKTASSAREQEKLCESSTSCQDYAAAEREHEAAKSSGTVSTVAFIASGALVATGAVLYFTAKPRSEEPRVSRLALVPVASESTAELWLRGEF